MSGGKPPSQPELIQVEFFTFGRKAFTLDRSTNEGVSQVGKALLAPLVDEDSSERIEKTSPSVN